MDLSGHHSNPSRPLESLLSGLIGTAERPTDSVGCGQIAAPTSAAGAVGAKHPRQGRIINAINGVLRDQAESMRAREVHASVEALLGEPVRWTSVKATLAGNLDGPAPRFVRVACGRYEIPLPSEPRDHRRARTWARPIGAPQHVAGATPR